MVAREMSQCEASETQISRFCQSDLNQSDLREVTKTEVTGRIEGEAFLEKLAGDLMRVTSRKIGLTKSGNLSFRFLPGTSKY